jgi:hypothetical protein
MCVFITAVPVTKKINGFNANVQWACVSCTDSAKNRGRKVSGGGRPAPHGEQEMK